jgi:hypothetical protein
MARVIAGVKKNSTIRAKTQGTRPHRTARREAGAEREKASREVTGASAAWTAPGTGAVAGRAVQAPAEGSEQHELVRFLDA